MFFLQLLDCKLKISHCRNNYFKILSISLNLTVKLYIVLGTFIKGGTGTPTKNHKLPTKN